MRVLVTRPEPDASDTARRLAELGLEPVIWPLLEMEILRAPLPDDIGWRGLALTSINGARALAARGDIAALRHLPVYAVGDRTAAEARELGFATVTSAQGGGAKLAQRIIADGTSGPLLYPAAEERSFDLGAALAAAGIPLVTHPVYRMATTKRVPEAIAEAFDRETIGAVTLYSRRTAECLSRLLGPLLVPNGSHTFALCLSAAVAEGLTIGEEPPIGEGLGDAHLWDIRIAERPDEAGMMALASALLREDKAVTLGTKGSR